MPDFGNPFSGMNADRPLNKEELIRAIRFVIAAEYGLFSFILSWRILFKTIMRPRFFGT